MRREVLLPEQMRDDPGGHEMRADGDLRIEFANEFYERARVQPVELQSQIVAFPRLIAGFVNPAEHVRRTADELHIERRVKLAEDGGGEVERIRVLHRRDTFIARERLLQSLPCANVAGAGTGGNDQDTFLHAARLRMEINASESQGGSGKKSFRRGQRLRLADAADEAFPALVAGQDLDLDAEKNDGHIERVELRRKAHGVLFRGHGEIEIAPNTAVVELSLIHI